MSRHGAGALLVLLALMAAVAAGPAAAQERVPVPYEEKEFPRWLLDLRRFEVIMVGSFPFTMFFTFEAYDTYRYVANGLDPYYAPWPFRPGSAQVYSSEEKTWAVVSAVSLAALIAAADYIIGRIHERSARR